MSVLFDFVPSEEGGSVEIDFSFQNGKLRTVISGHIRCKTGRNVDMFFVSAVFYFVILNNWKGCVMSRARAP